MHARVIAAFAGNRRRLNGRDTDQLSVSAEQSGPTFRALQARVRGYVRTFG